MVLLAVVGDVGDVWGWSPVADNGSRGIIVQFGRAP